MTEKKRRLFDELKDGIEELAAAREGKVALHKETRVIFTPDEIEKLVEHYRALSAMIPLKPIKTKAEYDHAVVVLDALLDAGGADEDHELARWADLVGGLIEEYERTQ